MKSINQYLLELSNEIKEVSVWHPEVKLKIHIPKYMWDSEELEPLKMYSNYEFVKSDHDNYIELEMISFDIQDGTNSTSNLIMIKND